MTKATTVSSRLPLSRIAIPAATRPLATETSHRGYGLAAELISAIRCRADRRSMVWCTRWSTKSSTSVSEP